MASDCSKQLALRFELPASHLGRIENFAATSPFLAASKPPPSPDEIRSPTAVFYAAVV
jgi:hypothetical protein